MTSAIFRSLPLLVFLALTACQKEWLEAKSDAKLTVPSTLTDFQAMLDDPNTMSYTSSELGEIASDGHFVNDANYARATAGQRKDAYIWSKKGVYITEGENHWPTFYRNILYCNIVLEGLEKVKPQDPAETIEMNNIKGQALFHRALAFFQLAQVFAPPYFSSDPDSEFGIILRLNTDITQVSTRSTLKQTYDQIINDLKDAESLLPNRPKILTRGSKLAVCGLLARAYLCLGQYSDALEYSNKCLNIHSKLLDFNTLSTDAISIGLYNDEVMFHHYMTSSQLVTSSYCQFDSGFYNQYAEKDLRRSVFFKSTSDGAFTFKGNYGETSNRHFNGLATDEVLLTRSECLARTGKYQDAMKDLNLLLKSRWDKNFEYIEKTAANKEEALQLILLERKKSLILRGIRWMDLRRLNKAVDTRITLTRIVAGETFTLEPNSYKYAFPIPDLIVTQTGIKQNPGW